MFLKNLHLTGYRNISQLDLEFSPVTLLIGENAQGKSNILESIYFLATTKSPRADRDLQLIKKGESVLRVEGEIEEEKDEMTKLEIAMQTFSQEEELVPSIEKRVKVNGIGRRVMDYIGNLVVVYFAPEDINLVSGPPALRRWYLDINLVQVDRQYKQALNEYSTALTSRNRLLKKIQEGLAKTSELDFWTQKIIDSGQIISQKRRYFFQIVNQQSEVLSSMISLGCFGYSYWESVISAERIKEYQPREIAAATTLIGPHRDDFTFTLNGQNLANFGSRGEQRTAVLELKLAQLHFMTEAKKTKPVLLLDDVFSELDTQHRDYVISLVKDQQTVITAVENEQIPEEFLKSIQVLKVEKGKIIRI